MKTAHASDRERSPIAVIVVWNLLKPCTMFLLKVSGQRQSYIAYNGMNGASMRAPGKMDCACLDKTHLCSNSQKEHKTLFHLNMAFIGMYI